ncbi:MAG: hypothetical protein AAF509_03505 [Pseudomonadota bacterium]
MSSAEASSAAFATGQAGERSDVLWPLIVLTALAAFAIYLPNLADPMLRHDDYPALIADPSGFWAKTLSEGRWVNYLWHLRELVTPAWLNFAVYQLLWATFAATTARVALGPDAESFAALALALMILISPSAMLISLWFNTLIPGLALVALYAVLACVLRQSWLRVALVPFVVVTFMAYTTYPLLILIVALLATRQRSFLDLVGLMALFAGSMVLALLATYAINWQVHGIFGVELADWRDAQPAADVAGYLANLPALHESFDFILRNIGFNFWPATVFHLALFVGAALVLLRRVPMEALYLLAGFLVGVALVITQALKLGVLVPPRAFIFAWVIYAVIAVRAMQELSLSPGLAGRMARNAVLLVVGSILLQTFLQMMTYRDWQQETRHLAQAITPETTEIYIMGDASHLTSAMKAGVQSGIALDFRLHMMTGIMPESCDDADVRCDALATLPPRITGVEGLDVYQEDGVTLVHVTAKPET